MMRLVVRTEGIGGLYRGITPTLLGIVPYAGLKFYVYQSLKVCCHVPGLAARQLMPAEYCVASE